MATHWAMWRPEALVETVSDMLAMRNIETLRHMDNVEARASVDTQANTPSEAKAEIMVKTPQDLKAQALVHTVVYKVANAKPEKLGQTICKVETKGLVDRLAFF